MIIDIYHITVYDYRYQFNVTFYGLEPMFSNIHF